MTSLSKSDIAYKLLESNITVRPGKYGNTEVRAQGINFSKGFDSTDLIGITQAVVEAHKLLDEKLARYHYLTTKEDLMGWIRSDES